jgi:hypothetical protein
LGAIREAECAGEGAYTDGYYSSFPNADAQLYKPGYPNAIVKETGTQLLYISPWQYFVEAGYQFLLADDTLTLDLTWTWRGAHRDFFTPVEGTIPAYGLSNARLTYAFHDSKWAVSLWANNTSKLLSFRELKKEFELYC